MMAPNFKMTFATMTLVMGSKWLLDYENPVHAWGVRIVYGLTQVLCFGVLALVYYKSMNNTEPGVVTVKEDVGFGQEGERDEKVTVAEHDMRACTKETQKVALGTIVTLFIHWKWGFFPPLLIQSLSQPFNLYQTPLVKVLLRGERAWGELKRPWKDPTTVGPQFNAWNDTITSALTGEPIVKRNPNRKQKKEKRKTR